MGSFISLALFLGRRENFLAGFWNKDQIWVWLISQLARESGNCLENVWNFSEEISRVKFADVIFAAGESGKPENGFRRYAWRTLEYSRFD